MFCEFWVSYCHSRSVAHQNTERGRLIVNCRGAGWHVYHCFKVQMKSFEIYCSNATSVFTKQIKTGNMLVLCNEMNKRWPIENEDNIFKKQTKKKHFVYIFFSWLDIPKRVCNFECIICSIARMPRHFSNQRFPERINGIFSQKVFWSIRW